MTAEILCVGTELLLGDIVNTNAAFLARELATLGISVYDQTVVGDNRERLTSAVQSALKRSEMLIMTGGLGPTCDDLTKEVASEALHRKLVWNEEAYRRMKDYFSRTGRVMSENNRKQAFVPEDSIVLQNENGTAPGIFMEDGEKIVIMLPGPPGEMEPMFQTQVSPMLEKKTGCTFYSRTIHLFGIGESGAEEILRDLMETGTNPTLAPYAKTGEVLLRATASASTKEKAKDHIAPLLAKIQERLGNYIYGIDVGTLENAVIQCLKEKRITAAVAESCTGGGVAKRMTSIPGASQVFLGGVCTYTNEMKRAFLSVSAKTLEQYGAVSAQTALEMAKGVRQATGAKIGISTTGIAGTDPAEGKPVGLVYVGVSCPWKEQVLELHLAAGRGDDREKIRHLAENHALFLLLQAAKARDEREGGTL